MRPVRRTVLVLYVFCACCVNRSSAVQKTVEARVLVMYEGKLEQCKVKVEYGFRMVNSLVTGLLTCYMKLL